MKRIIILLAAATLLLGACTAQQADNVVNFAQEWSAKVDNFNRAVAAINVDIVAKTSTTAAGYCKEAKSIGTNLTNLAAPNQTALTALDKITVALNDFCDVPPQDVAQALDVLTKAIADAKAAGG